MKIVIFILFLSIVETVVAQEKQVEEISAERQTELLYLLKQDCGSCHGMTLQGGLGSSLLPETA